MSGTQRRIARSPSMPGVEKHARHRWDYNNSIATPVGGTLRLPTSQGAVRHTIVAYTRLARFETWVSRVHDLQTTKASPTPVGPTQIPNFPKCFTMRLHVLYEFMFSHVLHMFDMTCVVIYNVMLLNAFVVSCVCLCEYVSRRLYIVT